MKRTATAMHQSPSPGSSASNSQSLNEEDDHLELAQELIVAGDKLESCSGSTDAKQRMKMRGDVLRIVRRLIDVVCDGVLRGDAGTNISLDDHRNQLHYTLHCLSAAHRCHPLNPETVKWTMIKLLLSKTSKIVDNKIGGFLQENMLNIARFLSTEEKMVFLCQVLEQLTDVVRGHRSSVYFYSSQCKELGSLYRVELEASSVTGSKYVIMLSIADLLLHGPFDFSKLHPSYVLRLWCLLHSFCCDPWLLASSKLINTSVFLASRLLTDGVWCGVSARLAAGFLISLADELTNHPSRGTQREDEAVLFDSVSSALKIYADKVLSEEDERIDDLPLEELLKWATTILSVIITRVDQGAVHNENTPVDRICSFVCCALSVVVEYDDADFFASEKAELLIKQCKLGVDAIVSGHMCVTEERSSFLPCLLSLLVHVDVVLGKDTQRKWIQETCNKICEDMRQSNRHEQIIGVRRSVCGALSLSNEEESRELMFSLMPDQKTLTQWIESASKLAQPQGSRLLISLFDLLFDVLSHIPAAMAIAFLSMPWLTVIDQTDTRHKKQIPLLREMNTLARQCRQHIDEAVLSRTLPAIGSRRLHGFSEWRRHIFTTALTSTNQNLVSSALEIFPEIVSTMESSSRASLLSTLISLIANKQLESNCEHVCAVLHALSRYFCALDPSTEFDSQTGIVCETCKKLVESNERNPLDHQVPSGIIKILDNLFNIDRVPATAQLRLQACRVLFSLCSHVNGFSRSNPELIKASLVFITDPDDEVRDDYLHSYSVIVADNVKFDVLTSIRSRLRECSIASDQSGGSGAFSIVQPFWTAGALFCPLQEFSSACLVELITQWIREFPDDSLSGDIHEVIVKKTRNDTGDDDPKRLFLRHIRSICRPLSDELSTFVFRSRSQEGFTDDVVASDVDQILRNVGKMFGYDTLGSFLSVAGTHIVSYLLIYCNPDTYHKGDIQMVFNRICTGLVRSGKEVIKEIVPSLMEKCIHENKFTKSSFPRIRRTISEFADTDVNQLYNERRYLITYYLLRNISVKSELIMNKLERMVHGVKTASLSQVLMFNCEYLGFLLYFRRHLLDDEHHELRRDFLASLAYIISNAGEEFLQASANKLLIVLRSSTSLGESVVPVWTAFVKHISTRLLAHLLPQILIAIEPLLVHSCSHQILTAIFSDKALVNEATSDLFTKTAMVLGGDSGKHSTLAEFLKPYIPQNAQANPELVIEACVRMLRDECDVVGRVVLRRLLSLLDGYPLEDTLAAQVVPALLHTIRSCGDDEVRELAARCLGRVGAVDPGRLGLSLSHRMMQTQKEQIVFVDNLQGEFFIWLVERCWRVYTATVDAELIYNVEYAIQTLLKLIVEHHQADLLDRLPAECIQDIAPLRSTKLSAQNVCRILTDERPLLKHCKDNFADWMVLCFTIGVEQVRQHPLCEVLKALKWMAYTKDTSFLREMLPQVIIQLIIEDNNHTLNQYVDEIDACLREAVASSGWIRMAAHVIFSVIDVLERYAHERSNKKLPNDKVLSSVLQFLANITETKLENGAVLVVTAAEKCGCHLRALRWCEQFAVKKGEDGCDIFNRDTFHTLQCVYSSLQDMDGVLGAYECIAKQTTPTADEMLLSLEATADYTKALPLYDQTTHNKEIKLIKCFLRHNQPQHALTTAEKMYAKMAETDSDPHVRNILEDAQVEAAWHMGQWSALDERLEKFSINKKGRETSWGASCASILRALRIKDGSQLKINVDSARHRVLSQLLAMTIEDSDAYELSYNYIAQLHILDEIEEEAVQTLSSSGTTRNIEETLNKWSKRSELLVPCVGVMEPVLRARRGLLAAGGPQNKPHICQTLLQSSRLARQAGDLQIAWAFLVEAKALGVCEQDICLEEARYEFQQGQATTAIGILNKLLQTKFSHMSSLFSQMSGQSQADVDRSARAHMLRLPREEKTHFAQVQLLHVEYMQKAGTMSVSDLYKIYHSLNSMDVKSEDLHYRVACFYDALMDSSSSDKEKYKVCGRVLRTYADALRMGTTHLFHVMPRMITIWLDLSEIIHNMIKSESNAQAKESMGKEIHVLNDIMRRAEDDLDPYMFYTAFAQLISRVMHPNEDVFTQLKNLIAMLLRRFPHQCLWQSIALYRPEPRGTHGAPTGDAESQKMKLQRVHQIFSVAERNDPKLRSLIDQYDYVGKLLVDFGNLKTSHGQKNDLDRIQPELFDFFKKGRIRTTMLSRNMASTSRQHRPAHNGGEIICTPQVMLPLTELMEKAIPRSNERDRVGSLTQMVVDESTPTAAHFEYTEDVFIKALDVEYMVLSSLQRPKKFSVRGNDGKTYPFMAKGGDELRKDARFNDFNRLMNCLMRRNPDSRRRQLTVKTFTVIPLASHGGVMEWLPNLVTYRHLLAPICEEKSGRKLPHVDPHRLAAMSLEERLRIFRKDFYPAFPLVFAEWFRRAFPEPCSWHAARVGYARSTAVMSMVGFVLGLGDRHGENILIDSRDGFIVHVDYNLLFNKGETLGVPECVPFRLTRNMVNGLGPTGVEGAYRRSCEATIRVMRENKDALLTVIGTLVHDPLIEFMQVERKQQNNQHSRKCLTAKENLQMIARRLDGHVVFLADFEHKWFERAAPMCVEGQVNKLIELATSETLLTKMYLGWAPYL